MRFAVGIALACGHLIMRHYVSLKNRHSPSDIMALSNALRRVNRRGLSDFLSLIFIFRPVLTTLRISHFYLFICHLRCVLLSSLFPALLTNA
jgi:hypothetical protein